MLELAAPGVGDGGRFGAEQEVVASDHLRTWRLVRRGGVGEPQSSSRIFSSAGGTTEPF
jgi:hypothetical protein